MAEDNQILIVNARYYEHISDQLVQGAIAEIELHGLSYEVVSVPGVFEIPAAINMAVRSTDIGSNRPVISGYVALGCVIKGETDHYEHICRESIRGLGHLIIAHTLALGLGILTCHTRDQAEQRAAVNKGNKGGEAAHAALEMVKTKRLFFGLSG